MFSQQKTTRPAIDLVIDWHGCRSIRETTVNDNTKAIHRIGDCDTLRSVEIAMAEALAVSEKR